ncbi:MAG: aminotransferase class I/II-fold pyridoxal phosphate-dependent enzyme [Deltaproteobacteria bacterium]|nr:aminotransferase class I/II-fold pyridoxal phosphate-dependent enzyme [Deltaproteobacteria bacterium]
MKRHFAVEPEQHSEDRVSLNLNVRGLAPSATVSINEESNRLIAAGRKVFKLGLGQSPFPVPECVVEALRANAHQKFYLEVQGLSELRAAVAEFHWRNDGVPADPSLVLVGPGSKELMFLMQVAYYGDLVVPTPCWVSYVPQAQILGHHVCLVPASFEEGWQFPADRLDELCREDPGRPRIVVLCYPGNPDGMTYDLQELQRLAAVARRYELILLSDEIYGKLHHRGEHVSVARFYPEGTIVSSGISKWCGAGGWRLGTFTFPPRLRWLLRAMTALASETFTSTSAPIQYAAMRAFQGGPELEEYLGQVRRILAALGGWCATRLRATGARIHDPVGAFYLFPDFGPLAAGLAAHGITTSSELCHRALAEIGVAILPGEEFQRPENELTVRLSYVDFDGEAVLQAARGTPSGAPLGDDFLHTHCARTVQAIEALCAWLGEMSA